MSVSNGTLRIYLALTTENEMLGDPHAVLTVAGVRPHPGASSCNHAWVSSAACHQLWYPNIMKIAQIRA